MEALKLCNTLKELSFSIGSSLHLNDMLEKALSGYCRHLECQFAVFYKFPKPKFNRKGDYSFSPPGEESKNNTIAEEAIQVLSKIFSNAEGEKKFPAVIQDSSKAYHHIFALANSGYLLLRKDHGSIDKDLLNHLEEINLQLGIACQNCINFQEAKQSELRFRELSDYLPEMICETDSNGFLTYANKFAYERMGYDREDMKKGFHITRLVHPRDKESLVNNFLLSVKNDNPVPNEYTAVTKSGEELPVLINASGIVRNNSVVGLRGVMTDISKQKETEQLIEVENKIKSRMSQAESLDEILDTCMEALDTHLNCRSIAVFLISEPNDTCKLSRYSNMDANSIQCLQDYISGIQIEEIKADTYIELNQGPECLKSSDPKIPDMVLLPIIKAKVLAGFIGVRPEKRIDESFFISQLLEKVISTSSNYIIRGIQDEKLKQFREDLETLFQTIDDFLIVLDAEARIIHTNQLIGNALGYDCEKIFGEKVNILFPPSKSREFDSIVNNLDENGNQVFTMPLISKEGKKIPSEVKIFSGRWENKKAFVMIIRDISVREKAAKKLRQQSKELKNGLVQQTLLSDIALELNAGADFHNRFNSILKRVGEHTGVSRVYIFEDNENATTTSNTYEWCNREISPQMEELQDIPYELIPSWKKILNEKGRVYSEDISELPQDIRNILEPQEIRSIVVYPLFVEEKFHGFIGFDECVRNKRWTHSELELLRTISGMISNAFERQKMQQSIINERDRANRANRAKSEFLANMSHEIRTPMNAILGYSEALFHRMKTTTDKNMVKYILNSGNLLLSLLNDILDLSKIEAGKMVVSPQPVDLVNVVHEIEMLFTQKAHKKNIGLSFTKSSDFPQALNMDEILIKQVLFNLIGNAIKFTHAGSVSMKLDFKPKNSKVGALFIEIRDTGIGIPVDQQEVIFEAFNQQEGQSSRKYEGTGLGLAISKRLVEKMGGEIQLVSQVNHGSVFTVYLPEVIIEHVSPRKSEYKGEDIKHVDFEDNLILIVDDVASNIKTVENMLGGCGLSFITAESGDIALETLNNTKPALVLLDLRMPGTDGYHVAEKIRNNPALRGVKIIAYTASIFSSDSIEESGNFDGYVFKPVNRTELIRKLMEFLPYKKQKVTPDAKPAKTLRKSQIKLSQQELEIAPQMLKGLEKEFLGNWNEIKETLVLYKIEEFIKHLRAFGEKSAFTPVTAYAEQLQEDMDILDLDSLKKDLLKFSELVEDLRTVTMN